MAAGASGLDRLRGRRLLRARRPGLSAEGPARQRLRILPAPDDARQDLSEPFRSEGSGVNTIVPLEELLDLLSDAEVDRMELRAWTCAASAWNRYHQSVQ